MAQSYLFMHQCNQRDDFHESAELSGSMKFDDVREWENTNRQTCEAYLQFKGRKQNVL